MKQPLSIVLDQVTGRTLDGRGTGDERLREEQKGCDERLREEQKGCDERLREEQRTLKEATTSG
jgi:hypothetical protein